MTKLLNDKRQCILEMTLPLRNVEVCYWYRHNPSLAQESEAVLAIRVVRVDATSDNLREQQNRRSPPRQQETRG